MIIIYDHLNLHILNLFIITTKVVDAVHWIIILLLRGPQIFPVLLFPRQQTDNIFYFIIKGVSALLPAY